MKRNILVVTLYPATDYLFWPKDNAYQISRGGKGVNVERALKILRFHPVSLCLEQKTIRSNITIYGKTKKAKRFMGLGMPSTVRQKNQFKKRFQSLLKQAELVLLCGSAPSGCEDFYPWMIREARNNQKTVWVDTSRKALNLSVQSKPHLIKPNLKELEEWAGQPLTTRRAQVKALQQLSRRGMETIVVTMGARGAMLCKDRQIWYAKPPKSPVLSDLGCGDVFFAGLCAAFLKKQSPEKMLTHALAAATASAATRIPGQFQRSCYLDLVKKINVQHI